MTIALGEAEEITCVRSALWLVSDADGPIVLMLRADDRGMGETLELEAMAADRGRCEATLAELRLLMAKLNVYRGRVLELRSHHFHNDEGAPLTVRALPQVTRDQIALPEAVLERIERQGRPASARPSRPSTSRRRCPSARWSC